MENEDNVFDIIENVLNDMVVDFNKNLKDEIEKNRNDLTKINIEPSKIFDTINNSLIKNNAESSEIDFINSLREDPNLIRQFNLIKDLHLGRKLPTENIVENPSVHDRTMAAINPKIKNHVAYSDAMAGSGSTLIGVLSMKPDDIFRMTDAAAKFKLTYESKRLNIISSRRRVFEESFVNPSVAVALPIDYSSILDGDIDVTAPRAGENVTYDVKSGKIRIKKIKQNKGGMFSTKFDLQRMNRKNEKTNAHFTKAGVFFNGVGGLKGIADSIIHIDVGSKSESALRMSQGATGLSLGIVSTTTAITDAIHLKTGSALAAKSSKYLSVVGGFLSCAVNITNVAKNVEASQSTSGARAAAFAIMATLDAITAVVDIISGIVTIIPGGQIISAIMSLISLSLSAISDLIGFFVEHFDTRTNEIKLSEEYHKYINSKEFDAYLTALQNTFKKAGYHALIVRTDPTTIGIYDVDTATQRKYQNEIIRSLTQQSIAQKNILWRLAILDSTNIEDDIIGGHNSDIIKTFSHNIKPGIKDIYSYGGADYIEVGNGIRNVYAGDGDDKILVNNLFRKDQQISLGNGNDLVVPYIMHNYKFANYHQQNNIPYLKWGANIDGGDGNDIIAYSEVSLIDGGRDIDTLLISWVNVKNDKEKNYITLTPDRTPGRERYLTVNINGKYNHDIQNMENVAINDAENFNFIAVSTPVNNNRIALKWDVNASNVIADTAFATIYANRSESFIDFIGLHKNMALIATVIGYNTPTNKFSPIPQAYKHNEKLLNSNVFSVFNTQQEFASKEYYFSKGSISKSTVLKISRDSFGPRDVIFKDLDDKYAYARVGEPEFFCSNIHIYILGFMGKVGNDISKVSYDFSRKKEQVPIISVEDPYALVLGSSHSNIFELNIPFDEVPDYVFASQDSDYKLVSIDGHEGINTIDMYHVKDDLNIVHNTSTSGTIRTSSKNKIICKYDSIQSLKMPKIGSSHVSIGFINATIECNGGAHRITASSANNNEFISLAGIHDVDYNKTTGNTIFVSPQRESAKEKLSILVSFNNHKLLDVVSPSNNDPIYYEYVTITVNNREVSYNSTLEKLMFSDGIELLTLNETSLEYYDGIPYISTEFLNKTVEHILSVSNLLHIYQSRNKPQAFHLTMEFTREFPSSLVRANLLGNNNELFIRGVNKADDIGFTLTYEGLCFFNKKTNNVFYIDKAWALSLDESMDSKLNRFNKRYSMISFIGTDSNKRSYKGDVFCEYIKSTLPDISVKSTQYMNYKIFTPKFILGEFSHRVVNSLDGLNVVSDNSRKTDFKSIDLNFGHTIFEGTNLFTWIDLKNAINNNIGYDFKYDLNLQGGEFIRLSVLDNLIYYFKMEQRKNLGLKILYFDNINYKKVLIETLKDSEGTYMIFKNKKTGVPFIRFKGRLPHVIIFKKEKKLIVSENDFSYRII